MRYGGHVTVIPMRVYKFLQAAHGVDSIARKRLKVSRINELNDPFEFLAADLSVPWKRVAFENYKNDLHHEYGLVSFSIHSNNPLLWGHYAGSHTGIALGFDVPDDVLVPVSYTDTRFRGVFDEASRSIIDIPKIRNKILGTKFSDWKYEKEKRIFLKLEETYEELGLKFIEFSKNLDLKEIIIGANSSLNTTHLMEKFGFSVNEVYIKKYKLGSREFKLVEDKGGRLPKSSSVKSGS
jgi:hypothetical protein